MLSSNTCPGCKHAFKTTSRKATHLAKCSKYQTYSRSRDNRSKYEAVAQATSRPILNVNQEIASSNKAIHPTRLSNIDTSIYAFDDELPTIISDIISTEPTTSQESVLQTTSDFILTPSNPFFIEVTAGTDILDNRSSANASLSTTNTRVFSLSSSPSVDYKEPYDKSRRAGQPIPWVSTQPEEADAHYKSADALFPFQNIQEYELIKFFTNANLSKAKIREFITNDALMQSYSLAEPLTISSIREKISRIPGGVRPDIWQAEKVTVRRADGDTNPREYTLIRRDIIPLLQYLLGHKPFAPDLVFAPEKCYSQRPTESFAGVRRYTEMHTANLWHRIQDSLPDGATAVPVIYSSDKTLLTQLQGDQAIWPVYISIGNLSSQARQCNSRHALLLVALLPKVHRPNAKDNSLRFEAYHECMRRVFKSMQEASREGVNILCADGHVRWCFPRLAGVMADYEEHTLITGIRSGYQCPTCQVHPDSRTDLTRRDLPRSHVSTRNIIEQAKIAEREGETRFSQSGIWRKEAKKRYEKEKELLKQDRVHDIQNFAWEHHRVNIHEIIMTDLLHQLLKGVVMRVVEDTCKLLKDKDSILRGGSTTPLRPSEGTVQHRIDSRFAQVSLYPGLRTFKSFSTIKQWTAQENKALARIILPVFVPLLIAAKKQDVISFLTALVDFVALSTYSAHDADTLEYMSHTLKRLSKLQYALEPEGYSFPKWHSLVHFSDSIRKWGSLRSIGTETGENRHILFKKLYKNTNHHSDFERQIIPLYDQHFNMDIFEARLKVTKEEADREKKYGQGTDKFKSFDDISAGVNDPMHRPDERVSIVAGSIRSVAKLGLGSSSRTMTVRELEEYLQDKETCDAIAAFVRTSRLEVQGISTMDESVEYRAADPTAVSELRLKLYSSIRCWQKTGKNADDLEEESRQLARCTNDWYSKGRERRDVVWLQEYARSGREDEPAYHGMRLGKLKAIFAITDDTMSNSRGRPLEYTGVLVEVLRLQNKGRPAPGSRHGMLVAESLPLSTARRSSYKLGALRVYRPDTVLRLAHLVSCSEDSDGPWFVNNHIDWEQYNLLYDAEWWEESLEFAERYRRQPQPPALAAEVVQAKRDDRQPQKKRQRGMGK